MVKLQVTGNTLKERVILNTMMKFCMTTLPLKDQERRKIWDFWKKTRINYLQDAGHPV